MKIDIDRLHNNIVNCDLSNRSGKTIILMSTIDNYISLGNTPIIVFTSQLKNISLYKRELQKIIRDRSIVIQSDSILVVKNEDNKNIEIRFTLARAKYLLLSPDFFPIITDDLLYDNSREVMEFKNQFKLRFITEPNDKWFDALTCLRNRENNGN